MILISVKSEVAEDKRQFRSDRTAMRFLKAIQKLHESHRIAIVGKKPQRKDFKVKLGHKSYISQTRYDQAVKDWRLAMNTTLQLKVEIINTEANQLNLAI